MHGIPPRSLLTLYAPSYGVRDVHALTKIKPAVDCGDVRLENRCGATALLADPDIKPAAGLQPKRAIAPLRRRADEQDGGKAGSGRGLLLRNPGHGVQTRHIVQPYLAALYFD